MSKLNDLENPDGVPFPPSRLLMDDHVQMYYNFCRAAPEDVLSCVTGPSRPLVLLLAPGDTRSLIYTLYRNFDPEFRGRFEGADFLVNENWTLLLARHVLILQLCLQLPHKIDSEEGRYMCAAVWAICYNPTLRPPHLPILKKALSELLRYGCALDVWYCPENPLGRIVKFSNEKTFNAVVRHWVIWSEDSPSYVPTVVRLQELRYSFLMLQHAESMRYVVNAFSEQCVAYLLGLTADTVPKKTQRVMWEEFANFLQLSLAYAEEMLELPVDKDWEPKVNPTFFDGSSHTWKHSPFYGRVPFFGFFHSFLFTPSGCRQGNIARSLCDKLLVADNKFESHPLLANSLQQMIIWFSATSRALRKLTVQTSPCVTFTFHCSDPITLCMRLQQSPELFASSLGADPSFDLVHSFETVDSISPPDLILHAAPLLKQDCFLIVKTVDYRTVAPTLESYLGSVFGVHPQIFPVMYGIRCVGEDGSFADCSIVRHTMWDQAHRHKGHDVQTLVFQRLLTTPFVLDSLDEIDFAPRALVSCIHATTYNFPVNRYAHMMSMQTVVTGIFAFISQMEANTPIHRWQFWDGYVRLIKEEKTLESYRHHIQTVAMLHGIHLHITVTERDCPICRYRPLSSFISFFSVAIKDPEMVPHMTIGLFVHPEARRAENFLSNAKDSHAIHSVALRKGEKGQCFIEFFFPKEFVERSYKLTVVKFTERDILGRKVQVPELLHQDPLEDSMAKGPPRYWFQQLPKRRSSISSGFGDLQLHVAGCEKANSVLDIPSNLVYRLDCSNMIVDSDEESQMHLCLKVSEYCKYDIYYPYPVVFSEMKIQFHCKDDTATITAPRDQHSYHATPPLFLVTPTNRLFLPATPVNPSLSRDYLALQMSPVEEEIHSRKVSKWVPPIIRLKYILRDLFQLASSGCRFVHVHTTKTASDSKLQGMIIIHDEVIDLDTRSPAIDLSFSFLKGKEEETEFAATWTKITSDHTSRIFSLPHENLEHFTRMLGYYASRTHTIYTDNNRTTLCRIKILRRNNIDSFFTRAVVFPMYASTDQQVGKPSEDPKGAEQSAMKKIPHFIAGVFSQGGVPVNDEVKKVIESLSPSKRNSEGGRSGGTQISVTTHTANLDVFGALFEALQGSPNAKTSQLLHMFAELPSSVTIGPISLSTGEDERRSRTATRTTTETGGGTKSSAAGGTGAATKPVPPTPKPRELKETREKLKEKMRQKAKERTKEKVRAAQVSSPTAEERRGKSKSAEGNSKTEKSKPLKKENKPSNTEENPSTKKGKSAAVAEEKTSAKEPKSSTNEVKTSTKVEAGEVKLSQEKPPQPPETAPKKEERGGEGGKKTGNDPVYSGALEDEEDSGNTGGKHKAKSNGKEGVRSKSKCTNCGRSSDHMKKCAGCGGPRYCSRECQRQHWKQHKPYCTSEDKAGEGKAGEGKREKEPAVPKPPPREKPAEVAPTMFTCTTCGRTSENLKRCKCVKAFYCGTECQRKDWPHHKQTCSAAPLKKVSLSLAPPIVSHDIR